MFFKYIDGLLTYGNEIFNSNYHLSSADITVEIDGWKWFNTIEEALSMALTIIPSDPIELTSNSFKMFGLGSQIYITPMISGKIRFTIKYIPNGSGFNGYNSFKISYGTGTAPINGTDATGTIIGNIDFGGNTISITSTPTSIIRNVIITNLPLGISHWFDIQGSKYPINQSVGIKNIEATLEELLA
jgi:hypothetical protein